MSDNPFLTLLVEALNLMHPRFAAGHGWAYPPAEVDSPAAARKNRECSFRHEFYHQFRRLWDKALPVKLGLGHVVIQADPDAPAGRQPDFLFWQLGEHGAPDRRLAAVSLVFASNTAALEAEGAALARYHRELGYPHAVGILIGAPQPEWPPPAGVTRIVYDPERHTAAIADDRVP